MVCWMASAGADSALRLAQRVEPQVRVPATIVVAPAAKASLPIEVGPQGSVPRNSFVRIRGLPPSVALNDGHSIAPGSWSVPLSALPSLQVNIPSALTGGAEVVISLVTDDGIVLAEARTRFRSPRRRRPLRRSRLGPIRSSCPARTGSKR